MGRWTDGKLFDGFPAALLVGGAAAGVVGIGLGESLVTAATAGSGVCVLVMLNYWVVTRHARRQASRPKQPVTDGTPGGRSKTAANAAPPEVAQWLRRAGRAADRLTEYQRGATESDTSVVSLALREALGEAAAIARAASDQLGERMAAVEVIDAAIGEADSRELRTEEARLTREAELTEPGPLRSAKEESARAVADQSESLERLEELRRLLLATLQSLTLRLESVVQHVGMLMSVHAADEIAGQQAETAPLTAELRMVEDGLVRLAELARQRPRKV